MKVVTMNECTDAEGYLHLTIPAEFKSTQAEIIVIINPIPEKKDFSELKKLSGKLKWKGDSMELQKKIRNEWP